MSESNLKETIRQNTEEVAPEQEAKKPVEIKDNKKSYNDICLFQTRAKQAQEEGCVNFIIGHKDYDTEYVNSFCNHLDKVAQDESAYDEFMLRVLKDSSERGKTGECFGKKFSSPEECVDVMRGIQAIRNLHGFYLGCSPKMQDYEKVIKSLEKEGMEFKYNGKKYDLLLEGLSTEEQMKYTGVLNEEVSQDVDFKTRKLIRDNMEREFDSSFPISIRDTSKKGKNQEEMIKCLGRFYKLMECSGYPQMREIKDSMAEGVVRGCPHFIPGLGGGTCYADTLKDQVAEMSHAFRNNNNFFGEAYQYARDGLVDIATLKSAGFGWKAAQKNYSDPDKMEFDTHRVVEPELRNYLNGETKTVEQMYAKIDQRRKAVDNTYAPTLAAKRKIEKGYKEIEQEEKSKKELANGTIISSVARDRS